MYYIYILKSKISSKFYIGKTEDIKTRLKLHNSGRITSTKKDKPWNLIHFEKFLRPREASKRELQIKKWKSRKAIENLIIKSRTLDFSTKLK